MTTPMSLAEPPATADAPVYALVAGEASGDQLGGELIAALRRRNANARFVGIGGAHMRAQGLEAWHDVSELAVMGFAEVLGHLPRLMRLRRQLIRCLRALRPDAVIGIDAPDFNLGVEKAMKRAGIPAVHYVSPSIWAWRSGRAAKIGRSTDRVLCLFPMEPAIYAAHGIDARFVGHPLAARFPLVPERAQARKALGLDQTQTVLALLPGSRHGEIDRLGPTFIAAVKTVATQIPGLTTLIPAANAACREQLADMLGGNSPTTSGAIRLLDGQAHAALQAADVTLLASGTATLEAMLAKSPMVVGYRVAPASYWIARSLRMIKTDIFSLPNILARADDPRMPLPVPELMQSGFTAAGLAEAVLVLLHDPTHRDRIRDRFEALHRQLLGAQDGHAADHAAAAVDELIAQRQTRARDHA